MPAVPDTIHTPTFVFMGTLFISAILALIREIKARDHMIGELQTKIQVKIESCQKDCERRIAENAESWRVVVDTVRAECRDTQDTNAEFVEKFITLQRESNQLIITQMTKMAETLDILVNTIKPRKSSV